MREATTYIWRGQCQVVWLAYMTYDRPIYAGVGHNLNQNLIDECTNGRASRQGWGLKLCELKKVSAVRREWEGNTTFFVIRQILWHMSKIRSFVLNLLMLESCLSISDYDAFWPLSSFAMLWHSHRGFSTAHAVLISAVAGHLLLVSDFFRDDAAYGPAVFRSSIFSQLFLGVSTNNPTSLHMWCWIQICFRCWLGETLMWRAGFDWLLHFGSSHDFALLPSIGW